MASRELGGQVQDLDELVAPVTPGVADQGEQIDAQPEPGGPDDSLHRLR
jgi:hypothetical protein